MCLGIITIQWLTPKEGGSLTIIQQHSKKIFTLAICLVLAYFSFAQLTKSEIGLETFEENIHGSPITITKPIGLESDLIFIAHGYAGSSSFMRPIAVSLAHAGFTTIRFDFKGHGRHPTPYSGDVTSSSGATQIFLEQTNKIIDHYLEERKNTKGIIIGHSMASDIIFRVASLNPSILSSIGISNYTDVINKTQPKNVLILNGEWEPRLRKKAINILQEMGIDEPKENRLYGFFNDGTARKALSIPNTDHVSILYSTVTQKALINWLDNIENSSHTIKTNHIGIWTVILLISLTLSFCLISRLIEKKISHKFNINLTRCFSANLTSGLITPLILKFNFFIFVPFPAHNYLINHLLLYSIITYMFFPKSTFKLLMKKFNFAICIGLFFFYTFIFGGVLDEFVSSFYLKSTRIPLFIVLFIGCIPMALAVQIYHGARHHSFLMGNLTKASLILSLVLAIILNSPDLIILAYGILLLLLFFLVFSFLSNFLNKHHENVLSVGVANGITLAWTFASALPLYIP